MSRNKRAKDDRVAEDLVKFIKDHSAPQDDLRSFFEVETDRLAVPRFRLCVAILFLLFVISFLLDTLSKGDFTLTLASKVRVAASGVLLFFCALSFLPQFRKSCYAFTVMLAVAVGAATALIQLNGSPTSVDHMGTYTLFFIMMGFLMPWGGFATAGICFSIYLFYPLGLLLLGESVEPEWMIKSNMFLGIYITVAVIAAHMNEGMRFKEFALKKRMEGENRLLQDYQVRLKRAYERMENLALIDTLSGAFNRSYLTRWLATDVYKDKNCQDYFSIIMFDVDGFKTINDKAGHLQGDRILQLVTQNVKDTVTSQALVFRYGGDEFCVCLPGVELYEATLVAERLRQFMELDPNLYVALPSGEGFHITISIGVTMETAARSIDSDFLIKWVDAALLESKRQGRNCIHVFDPEDRKIASLEEWQKAREEKKTTGAGGED